MSVKFLAQVTGVTLGLFSVVAVAENLQSVYSLKNFGTKQTASGEMVKRTQVKCNAHSQYVYIIRKLKAKKWCVEGAENKCDKTRIGAATKACLLDPATLSVQAPNKPQVQVEPKVQAEPKVSEAELKALAEREKLEAELKLTQQKKDELKAKQSDLRKKELELKRLKDES